MKIKKMMEAGYEQALVGLGLSYNNPDTDLADLSLRLCSKDGGHNKFLESMAVWLDIRAARYWWQQFDTYRTGTSKQSESTMHTIMKRCLTQDDFEIPIYPETLDHLNNLIECKAFEQLKNDLPEGFLQRRIVCTNYRVLRCMVMQRQSHKLGEWKHFCYFLHKQLDHPLLLGAG